MKDIFSGALDVNEAQKILDDILESPDAASIEALSMMSRIEWTAYGQGAPLFQIAQWRYGGWPQRCALCNQELEINRFGWLVRDIRGLPALQHVKCPPVSKPR
ncbi:MAG: hypothetical protein JSS45_13875 [Proteobacteria bacterium]|nr:hypothetical protein [Pseudomonadota bacterium]